MKQMKLQRLVLCADLEQLMMKNAWHVAHDSQLTLFAVYFCKNL